MPETVPNTPRTLRAVFGDLSADSPAIELATDADVAAEAKARAEVIEWKSASSLLPEVARLLDVPLPKLLVGFWQKADEVAAALEKSKESPDKKTKVSFYDSKTEASFSPHIEVRLNGVQPGKQIPFKVVLPLTFKGVVLMIQNGEIVDAAGGECVIEGSIKLGALTVAKLRKPVTISLAGGILGGKGLRNDLTLGG